MNVDLADRAPGATLDGEQTRRILKARARGLAQPLEERSIGDTLQVVEFRLAHERFAVERPFVREVQNLKDLTPLPGVARFVAGLINLRGQILPVIDVKKFFELPESGITDLHWVVVTRLGDLELGILADAITGVREIPLAAIQPSLPTLTGIRAEYLRGVTNDHLVILDVRKILTDPKLASGA